jgi:DNA polymerase III subunit delta
MKPRPSDTQQALKRLPDTIRTVLLFGPDQALIRDRMRALALQKLSSLQDPFNLVELSGSALADDPARLADEAASMSLMGGERVVIVRDAGESALPALQGALEQSGASALMILCSGDLKPADKLRKYAESSAQVMAIACYAEQGAAIVRLLQSEADSQGYTLRNDTAQWLLASTGGERDVARQELEKLILYVGRSSSTLELDAARQIGADSSSSDYAALISLVCDGQANAADSAVQKLVSEGAAGVPMLRALYRRLWQFAATHAGVEAGQDAAQLADRLFGRMAWKEKEPFLRQLRRWSRARTLAGLERLVRAEREIKLGGLPADLVSARCILALSR